MQEIDVEKIMEEIRQEIREKGYKESDLDFSDIVIDSTRSAASGYDPEEMERQAAYLNANSQNPIYFPLIGNPVKVFFQKIIRRCFLFVIFQAFQFQNKFNVSVTCFLNQVRNYQLENRELKERLDRQQERMNKLERELEELRGTLKGDGRGTV